MNKLALTILVLILLTMAVVVGVYLVQQQQQLGGNAAPATTILLISDTASPQVGDTITIQVNIATNTNAATGVDLKLTYDASKLEIVDIVPGTFLTGATPQEALTSTSDGSIRYVLTLPVGGTPQTGSGTLALIHAKALTPGAAVIADNGSKASGVLENTNILQTQPASLTISISSGTARVGSSPGSGIGSANTAPTASVSTAPAAGLSPTRPLTSQPTSSTGGGVTPTRVPTTTTPTSAIGQSNPTPTLHIISPTQITQLPNTGFEAPVMTISAFGMVLILGGAFVLFRL